MKESIKGIRSVLYDLSVSSSEYAGTYRGVLEVFNNTSGSAANAQDAFNIIYNALKEAGVPLDELNKKLAQEFPSAAQATKSSVDSSIVEAQKTVSSSTGKMKTDAETNLAGVKKAAEDASGGVNTTTVTNWGNSASEVKKNLDKMKQTANLKLGEMQKTVESHFSGQYNTMTKKWEKACERIGQLITQMVRSTKDSLNGLARNMNTIGNEMSNNLINGISGAVTGIAGILNEVVSKVNSTIGNVNSSLSGMENFIRASVKPLRKDDRPKASETIHRALTREEQQAFMQEAKTEWLYEFFCFSLCTGMRLNEITALKWQDIDYINNVIRVNKTVSWKEGGGIEETLPKSDTSNRDIPMNDTIKKILQMQKTKMSMVYGEIHARKMDSNIFIGSNGAKAIASSTVSSAIDNVLKRLRQQGIEIERFTHHAFRDTFATRYIEEGGNMQTLQKILGHSSLAMTADLYAHVLPNTKQQEMQQIENGFIGVAVL